MLLFLVVTSFRRSCSGARGIFIECTTAPAHCFVGGNTTTSPKTTFSQRALLHPLQTTYDVNNKRARRRVIYHNTGTLLCSKTIPTRQAFLLRTLSVVEPLETVTLRIAEGGIHYGPKTRETFNLQRRASETKENDQGHNPEIPFFY